MPLPTVFLSSWTCPTKRIIVIFDIFATKHELALHSVGKRQTCMKVVIASPFLCKSLLVWNSQCQAKPAHLIRTCPLLTSTNRRDSRSGHETFAKGFAGKDEERQKSVKRVRKYLAQHQSFFWPLLTCLSKSDVIAWPLWLNTNVTKQMYKWQKDKPEGRTCHSHTTAAHDCEKAPKHKKMNNNWERLQHWSVFQDF